MTGFYEPEQLQNLKSQLLERDKVIKNLEKMIKKETKEKSIDTKDLKSEEDEMVQVSLIKFKLFCLVGRLC